MSSLPTLQSQAMGKQNVNVAMAVAQSKPATQKAAKSSTTPKTKMQMHRRSRTGCYTCRLRRKKCDEGSPQCSACRNLGLTCHYKRPQWWGNNERRREHKDDIKMIIKEKKLREKSATTQVMTPGSDTPPGLSHSLPTSATFSDSIDRTRSASIDSSFSLEFDFNAGPSIADFTAYNAQMHSSHAQYVPMFPEMSPYEVDVKTERQMFVNDSLTRRESTISTFSTYHQPPPDAILASYPADASWEEGLYDDRRESMTEEPLDMNFFDFAHGTPTATRQVAIELNEGDQQLLDHFIDFVLPLIFPILETNQNGAVRSDIIIPALTSNNCYLHCCLSISAQHYKSTMNITGDQIDNDIIRHRYATVSELCAALNRDVEHQKILEATLGMIVFQCSVGRLDDTLATVSWHQHFQSAIALVQKLELPRIVLEMNETSHPAPFDMTLTSWIDILGATIQGRAPTFAHTYREKHLSSSNSSLGLRELMGCEDRVMYLISEIACLEALKYDGMDDISLCQHVHSLGDQIGLTEMGEGIPKIPFNAQGVLSPKQLSKNITACFRLAARIYLCSLVPGFSPSQASCVGLVAKLASALTLIPSGEGGFDRSLVWVYLIGGSVSTASSPFRTLFDERIMGLGEHAVYGSFGKLNCLLREVWSHVDGQQTPGGSEAQYVSWRDVMQMKGWDFLLI